jgi:hypothetical protein
MNFPMLAIYLLILIYILVIVAVFIVFIRILQLLEGGWEAILGEILLL